MRHGSLYLILVLATLMMSCQQEELRQEETKGMGRIVLSFSDIQVYADDVVTRSAYNANNPDNYDFTLSGTPEEGEAIVNLPIEFTDNMVSVPAGTYTLTATTKTTLSNAVPGVPTYTKTSGEFDITTGDDTPVSLAMGKPTNSRVTMSQSSAFSAKYDNIRLTLTAGGRSVDIGTATGCETEAFFPAGSVSYTLTAAARTGSHVTDITSASGSITLTAGKHHEISLTLNPATGEIVPIIEGTHTGSFD